MQADPEYKLLLTSDEYFQLYDHQGEYVLAITSFSPTDILQSVADTLELLKILKAKP